MDRFDSYLSDNMQMRMVLLDLSAKDVADLAGLTPGTISHYLNRARWPDPDNLNRIAKALSCSIPELLAPPIAQDKPNFAQAWKVMSEFMESLTPLRRRLLDVSSTMNETQLRGLVRSAEVMLNPPIGPDADAEFNEQPQQPRKAKIKR